MFVTIELRTGPRHDPHITKNEIQKNIDALARAIDGKPRAVDFASLTDTKSILELIREKLPNC